MYLLIYTSVCVCMCVCVCVCIYWHVCLTLCSTMGWCMLSWYYITVNATGDILKPMITVNHLLVLLFFWHHPSTSINDSVGFHLTDKVKRKIRKQVARQAIVPGSSTLLLQQMDVIDKKSFKNMRHNVWKKKREMNQRRYPIVTRPNNSALKAADSGLDCWWYRKYK